MTGSLFPSGDDPEAELLADEFESESGIGMAPDGYGDDAPGELVALGDDGLIPVPSGQEIRLLDVIRTSAGPAGLAYRFRFVAPEIARETGAVSYETAAGDMAMLCRDYALPRLASTGPQPGQIIISLSDQPLEFGMSDPGVTQYFDAFAIENGTCIWEMF